MAGAVENRNGGDHRNDKGREQTESLKERETQELLTSATTSR